LDSRVVQAGQASPLLLREQFTVVLPRRQRATFHHPQLSAALPRQIATFYCPLKKALLKVVHLFRG